MDVVDAWMQHPTPRFLRDPMFASLLRWMRMESVPDAIPLEMTLGAMKAGGVGVGLCSAWWGPSGPMISNDEVAEWVEASQGRLCGIGSIDLSSPMAGRTEARRCVEELGFVGLRSLPWLWNLPPNDRRFYPLYVSCIELGVPFCLQVGHTGPLRTSEYGRPIPYLDDVALDFPELTIVAGHIGYPWTEEMIALATKYENVYIDTSAYTPKRYPEALVRYMRGNGRRKVLFGTNFPMINPAKCMGQVDALGLDDEAKALFLAGNARRVFGLPQAEASRS